MSVSVTLRFKNKEQRDYFMGQLSDGWGENHVALRWRGDFYKAASFTVDPTVDRELWGHHQRMKKLFNRPTKKRFK